MPPLASDLRRQLENVCVQARELAEVAARAALQRRAVDAAEPFGHFGVAEKALRNRLRARGRQLGDVRHSNKTQTIDQLTQELAYEYWHRMLFARFLAENNLLMHPDGVPVSLADCEELAKELSVAGSQLSEERGDTLPPATDNRQLTTFSLAARYASRMLPQIFRADNVLLEVEFPINDRLPLEKLLATLPPSTFTADDSLGWVYQFWQSKKKDEVNKSGAKIDGRTLAAVTQLFTEHYMVEFLLDNTIGAWWAAKKLSVDSCQLSVKAEEDARRAVAVPGVDWNFLRFIPSENRQPTTDNFSAKPSGNRQPTTDNFSTPAAGTFEGWPKTLAEFTLLDPCCGSGHFLVAAFNKLVPLRMHDENLPAREACDAVLRDNLFGLEIDPRCTQIAAFALGLAAWKFPGDDGQPLGYRTLPPLNIACTGIGPAASEAEWMKLAEQSGKRMTALSREPILAGLRHLYALFSEAPTLGSLIDPGQLAEDLITADYETLKPYLQAALTAEVSDDDAHAHAVAAAGMVKAAEMLADEYTLVVTNVPYLGRGKQGDVLKRHIEKHYSAGKADLATAFVLRCLGLTAIGGTAALVTPQNWLFQPNSTALRRQVLHNQTWNALVSLGEEAWWTFGYRGPRAVLIIASSTPPAQSHAFMAIDVAGVRGKSIVTLEEKILRLAGHQTTPIIYLSQASQASSPDSRIVIGSATDSTMLSEFAFAPQGVKTGDDARYKRNWWEMSGFSEQWRRYAGGFDETSFVDGLHFAIDWSNNGRDFARLQGMGAWGRHGVLVRLMGDVRATNHWGEVFDSNVTAIVPKDPTHLPALWAYCASPEFSTQLKAAEQSVKANSGSVTKVPFDIAHWQEVAAEKYPNGLPEPHSDDPTQWLFKGDIATSNEPLQVAVARLLGYRWPEQPETPDAIDALADRDGIVCLPSVRGEPNAAERLLGVLAAAYGDKWSTTLLHDLLAAAATRAGTSLDDWLRNYFFEQHCKLFHQRPFIWHIWDGRKDGFSALVNYHKLDHKALENLTYSYLQDWITAQAGDAKQNKPGADLRLKAAQDLQQKLKLILAGEPFCDIFVRWKPLAEQPIGWHPDLNDGVRMNIRPFFEADILREKPNVKWGKDRGNEPERPKEDYPWFWKDGEPVGDRVNDIHLTNAEKQAARDSANHESRE